MARALLALEAAGLTLYAVVRGTHSRVIQPSFLRHSVLVEFDRVHLTDRQSFLITCFPINSR